MKIFIQFILVLVLVVVLALGYLGFIPGLSEVMGSNRPRDLGVKYTENDISTVQAKSQVTIDEVDSSPSGEPLTFSGSQAAEISFDSTEITALIAGARWRYFPFSNVQVKVNPDGTGEASGNINVAMLPQYFASFGVSTSDVKAAINYLKIQGKPAFYLKGKVSVTDNRVSFSPSTATIGRFPIPADLVAKGAPYLTAVVETRIKSIPGLDVKSFNLNNGMFNFVGTVPQIVTRAK